LGILGSLSFFCVLKFGGRGGGGCRWGELFVEMADDKKEGEGAGCRWKQGMNVAVLIGGDNEEVAVAGVTLVSVSD